MIPPAPPALDARDAEQLLAGLYARRPGYVPEWLPAERRLDAAIAPIVARYVFTLLQRLNKVPFKQQLAFLDVLGIQLTPAQAARAPIAFQLTANVADSRIPAGTRVAAPAPPGSNAPIVFETERATGLAAGRLAEVVSLWPGRDQRIDHTASFLALKPFQPFLRRDLEDTPHALYLAHDTLLALSGQSALNVDFELLQGGTKALPLVWEYFDGKVWREFKEMHPDCDETEAARLDSTDGFTRSGRFRLETDCAETGKTTVNGIEAFWIGGRLTETLPPDPTQILPDVDNVRISAEVARPLFTVMPPIEVDTPKISSVVVNVANDADQPLMGIGVELNGSSVNCKLPSETDVEGKVSCDLSTAPPASVIGIRVGDFKQSTTLLVQPNKTFKVKFVATGVKPDKAFSNQDPVDLTKTFQPFGPNPQPGTAFYFTSEEVFSKPGADLKALVVSYEGSTNGTLPHLLAWEYWNGQKWVAMFQSENAAHDSQSRDLARTWVLEQISVPPDMARTKVNGQDGLWMRVRLVSGSFGHTLTIPLTTGSNPPTQIVVITDPPTLVDFRLAYTWQYGPFPPERVLTFNDYRYEDHTEEAIWPGRTFRPFQPVDDATPALYLGFDKPPPVDRLGIFFDVEEKHGETDGPALVWEYWDGSAWRRLAVEDETRDLRVPGLVSFIGPNDSKSLARFGTLRHWLRARLKEDGPPGEPTLNGVYPNAVMAIQHQTVLDEPLGVSTGRADQVFTFRQFPVLPGQVVEVRELTGLRANVEWRNVASEVFGDNTAPALIRELEARLAAEGAQRDVQQGDLRLKRDRQKRVTEVWVRWQGQDHLRFSTATDRHYVIERARGRLAFGDGEHGRIPPVGANILVRQYLTGGGQAGNVAAQAISQLLGAVGAVEKAFNPRPAEGGADGETLEALVTRGPRTVRHRGRAILPQDYEVMAVEAAPDVAFARAVPGMDSAGRRVPGWVTLFILPQSNERRPWPSFGLREHVRKYIGANAAADVVAANHIHVTGPDFLAVDIDATVAVVDPAEAGAVERRVREALETFLHPLRGGPEGRGWALGRDVFLSDVAAVIEGVAGVDFVRELALARDGVPQGGSFRVPDDRIVVAGLIRLKLVVGEV